jgi:hypothetical protein
MKPIPSLRLWLAACGAGVAATVAAQEPSIPPPKIDLPISTTRSVTAPPLVLPARLAPVEKVGAAPVEKLPAIPDTPALQPPAPAESTFAVPSDAGTACPAPAVGKHGHEKCEYTKYGNLRTCKIPPSAAIAHGAVVRSIFERQKQLAMAEYFVVYREDFLTNTATLNDTGLRHATGIYKRLDVIDDSVLVEATGNAKLDEQRRDAVIRALIELGAPTGVSGRVGTGSTRAEGLRNEDVPSVGRRNPLLGGSGGGGAGGGVGGGAGGGVGGVGGFR